MSIAVQENRCDADVSSMTAATITLPRETADWLLDGASRFVVPVESVSCPTCKAEVLQFCQGRRTASGTPITHVARMRLVNRHQAAVHKALSQGR